MLGAIIGDICGSVYEFDNCKDYDRIELFANGCCVTDDSVMTLAVANALMDSPYLVHVTGTWKGAMKELLVRSMRYYGQLFPDAGYGRKFALWLMVGVPEPYNSYGNGSAMRVSSAGWLYDSLEDTLKAAELTASVSHNHPEGIKGAKAIAGAVYIARAGGSKEQIRSFVEGLGYDLNFTIDEIRSDYEFNETCQATVPEAVRCFLESTDFEQCIRLTLSLGGDCDTTAAMSGAIAEAFYGIPEWMKEKAFEIIPAPLTLIYRRFEELFSEE